MLNVCTQASFEFSNGNFADIRLAAIDGCLLL